MEWSWRGRGTRPGFPHRAQAHVRQRMRHTPGPRQRVCRGKTLSVVQPLRLHLCKRAQPFRRGKASGSLAQTCPCLRLANPRWRGSNCRSAWSPKQVNPTLRMAKLLRMVVALPLTAPARPPWLRRPQASSARAALRSLLQAAMRCLVAGQSRLQASCSQREAAAAAGIPRGSRPASQGTWRSLMLPPTTASRRATWPSLPRMRRWTSGSSRPLLPMLARPLR
mmetsp:Transcript_44013/g.131933  ORF Transcript_44013/g.131933 Transcript_44013/m.131933 type:complete len:223 (+) Transcript_44013:928-1596(+)